MRYAFLPPYSPDYNPIELAFSSMKAWFRRNTETVAAVWDRDLEARQLCIRMAFTATAEKAEGWFRKCNYPVD
jgi:transposase